MYRFNLEKDTKLKFLFSLKSFWSSLDVIQGRKVQFLENLTNFISFFALFPQNVVESWYLFILAPTNILMHYFIYEFFCYFLTFFRNLRRLVHAMILKRPPHEWIGAFRCFFSLYIFFRKCLIHLIYFDCWWRHKLIFIYTILSISILEGVP